jgi:transposase-like protein
MSTHTAGFKARMVQRMAGPESISATALAKEVGVSQNTLSRWLRQASVARPTVPPMKKKRQASQKGSARRSAQDKLRIVLEASALSEEDLGALLRREGLHEAELEEWRAKALEAAEGALKAPHGKALALRLVQPEIENGEALRDVLFSPARQVERWRNRPLSLKDSRETHAWSQRP